MKIKVCAHGKERESERGERAAGRESRAFTVAHRLPIAGVNGSPRRCRCRRRRRHPASASLSWQSRTCLPDESRPMRNNLGEQAAYTRLTRGRDAKQNCSTPIYPSRVTPGTTESYARCFDRFLYSMRTVARDTLCGQLDAYPRYPIGASVPMDPGKSCLSRYCERACM